MKIEESAKKLWAEHHDARWFQSIGIGGDVIYLYVHTLKQLPKAVKSLHKTEEGYNVMVVKMGKVKPA